MRENYDRIEVHPVTGALGAEIAGVDLSETLDNETFSEIYDAFLDHLVLFFHNQELTPGQHKAFARRFGDLHVHPLTRSMPGQPGNRRGHQGVGGTSQLGRRLAYRPAVSRRTALGFRALRA